MRRALPLAVALLVLAGVVWALAGGGSDPEAPPDRAAELVPASVGAYLHATTDGTQWERVRAALKDLPAIQSLLPGGAPAKPDWMGEEAALARDGARTLVLLEARKETEARAFAAPRGGALVDGFVVLGGGPGFAKPKRSLADAPAYEDLVSKLPEERTAHAWAVGDGLGELERTISVLSGPPGLKAAAFALGVEGDGARITLRAAPEPGEGRCERPRLAKPTLVDAAPASATGFLEITGAGCAAQELLGPPRNAVGS
ncbi:MAG: hypothetical protein H0V29_10275, partial [Thermoleophilaceae bacterium]|nr:hypothetical protein [Thermoleophilaceae bacterium]